MASANTVCRIVSTCAGGCKIGCSSFWSLQQRCSSFRNLICGARLRTDRWRFAEAKWTLFRAFCVTPSSTMPQQPRPQNESTSPTGCRGSSGVVPRPGAKVRHVVVQSRSLEDASSPRGAPSQRPGDNSTTIARTTAKWHSKAARKGRCSCPYASSWLLSPRDDARRSSRAVTLAPRSLADVRRREEGCTCIGSATTNPKLDGDRIRHESQRETHAPCAGRAPGRCTPNHRCQNYFGSSATTHLQSTATDRRRRRRKRRKKGC